jgi:uncharacterized protein
MRVLVFGATGRVGSEVASQAQQAGHAVTVFVRNPEKLSAPRGSLTVICGDVLDPISVASAIASRSFDAVVNAIGTGNLAPATLVTNGTQSILNGMHAAGQSRYLAVSGTAEMPEQTGLGRMTNAIFRRTPVGHAIRDHDGAYSFVKASGLDWTLAGCPYLRDGPAKGDYKTELTYPGGFKIIHPPDVADFLVRELADHRFSGKIVGLWY